MHMFHFAQPSAVFEQHMFAEIRLYKADIEETRRLWNITLKQGAKRRLRGVENKLPQLDKKRSMDENDYNVIYHYILFEFSNHAEILNKKGPEHASSDQRIAAAETCRAFEQLCQQMAHVLKDLRYVKEKGKRRLCTIITVELLFSWFKFELLDSKVVGTGAGGPKPTSQAGFQRIADRAAAQSAEIKGSIGNVAFTIHAFCEVAINENGEVTPVFAHAIEHAKSYDEDDEVLDPNVVRWWSDKANLPEAKPNPANVTWGLAYIEESVNRTLSSLQEVIAALTEYNDQDVLHAKHEEKRDAEDSDYDP
ncbi:hypothetical protein BN946_scf184910.g25 [Trametes cinnabarina]|uniref:Uncharacterized protein n=1 Tax=Pycnoporus cinnabarinus TaxID=5643 RepID=A0A060SBB8_PYCCI|nr:hypothetical protein BN946_scf184910.g25 [Trametes cinnabarina]